MGQFELRRQIKHLKMKLIVFFAIVAVAAAAELKPIQILRQSMDVDESGRYTHSFETENGIKVDESGANKQIDAENGVTFTVNWVADENGFQPSGAHLPVAPALPEYPQHVKDLLKTLADAGVL